MLSPSPRSREEVRNHPAVVFAEPSAWQKDPLDPKLWNCLLCLSGPFDRGHACQHQDSQSHTLRARVRDLRHQKENLFAPELPSGPEYSLKQPMPSSPPSVASPVSSPHQSPIPGSGYRQPLPSLPPTTPPPSFSVHGPRLSDDPEDLIYDDFAGDENIYITGYEDDPVVGIDGTLYDAFGPNDGNDALDSGSEHELLESMDVQPHWRSSLSVADPDYSESDDDNYDVLVDRSQSESHNEPHASWIPWFTREHCLLDLVSGFPRAVWSRTELDIVRWLLRQCDVEGVTSTKAQSRGRQQIMDLVGANPRTILGSMGHVYTINSLMSILQHEFNNPLVRPHMLFYPDDAGEVMEDSRHGTRWHTTSAEIACPMVCTGVNELAQDFYVYEPCLVRDGSSFVPVIPLRWFTRDNQLYANMYCLWVSDENEYYSLSPLFESHHYLNNVSISPSVFIQVANALAS